MQGELTLDMFAELADTSFRLETGDDEPSPLELVETTALGKHARPDARRKPFSLLFRGPPELRLHQHIYRMHHAVLGELEIFLVPVQPGEEGSLFEAVFN